jgi:hypothetical protein
LYFGCPSFKSCPSDFSNFCFQFSKVSIWEFWIITPKYNTSCSHSYQIIIHCHFCNFISTLHNIIFVADIAKLKE